MNKEKIFIIIVSVIILLCIPISVWLNEEFIEHNQTEKYTNVEKEAQVKDKKEKAKCQPDLELFIGKWSLPIENNDNDIFIIFDEQNYFTLNGFGGDGQEVNGTWTVNNEEKLPRLILNFNEIPVYWKDSLEDIKQGVFSIKYLGSKKFSIEIEYFETTNSFEGYCKDSNFYINLFNNLLYKDFNYGAN
jgi:hypothetical protein